MNGLAGLAEAWRRIAALVVREILAIWRDKRGRVVLILPPIMQLFVFSYAATFDLQHAPLAILNEDMGLPSRELVARFTASHAFTPAARLASDAEIAPVIENGRALAVLHIGPTFSRDLGAGRPPQVQVIVDGRQSNTALIALSYVTDIVAAFGRERAAEQGLRPAGGPQLVVRAWFNPNLDTQWFIIPGLVATLTMIIAMLTTALSVARERELGTFEQLLVTPLRPWELFVGKVLPPALIAFAEGAVLAVLGIVIFGVPLRGEVALMVIGLAVFMLSVTSVGLMISTFTSTQQQAQIASFCVVMPCIILSGFTTPIDNMPTWVQVLTYLNPLRYVLVINRGVFLQDIPVGVAFANIWPMAAIGVVTAFLAMRLFRSRVA
jgi:ABC-2 type transport system permease protein